MWSFSLRPTQPTSSVAAVAQLSSGGTTSTLVVETLTMASSEKGERPQMVDVTVVDPSQYPFYGRVLLQPQQSLPQTVDRNSIAVSQMLLVRLNARVGDTIHIAGQSFRVAAVLVSQPDRLFNDNVVALPVLMSTEAFASTGLIDTGKRLSTRYLFKLPPSASDLEPLRNQLTHLFPGSQITDFRHGKPELSEALDRATAGLSMICLFALVLACAGVSMTMRSHIRERMDAIATMKSLGATFSQILGIYLLQILLLAVVGSLTGIVLGFGLELLLLHFAQSFFSGTVAASWTWQTFVEALITGVLSTLLLTFPALLDVRTIKPLLILRRDFEPDRSRRALRVALFSAPILLGLGLLAAWLSNSRMIAEYFLVGLLAAIVALGLVAQLVLWAARSLSGSTAKISFLTNYALKSLSRPGNQTIAVLVALGISTGFTLGVFLIQRTILQELSERVPETLPSIILAGVTRYERPGLVELLQQRSEVTAPPEFIPMAQVRLMEVDGKPADQLFTVRSERRFLQPRPAAGVDAPPSGVIVTQGSWWNTQSTPEVVAIRDDVAQHLHLSPGSRLSFQLGPKLLPVTVAAVYRWQQRSLASSFDFILPLQALTDVPVLYVGGIRLKPGTADTVQSAIYQKFSQRHHLQPLRYPRRLRGHHQRDDADREMSGGIRDCGGPRCPDCERCWRSHGAVPRSCIPEVNRCDVAPDRGDVVDRIPAGRTVRGNHRRCLCEFIRRALGASVVSLHATHRMGAHRHCPVRYGRACHRRRLVSELPSTTFATERSIALNRIALAVRRRPQLEFNPRNQSHADVPHAPAVIRNLSSAQATRESG